MGEPGSLSERVKQQADIVRVIGEYVRLKKSGQNFSGLCPFHSEKTPSFSVSQTKQFYYCFGCGIGGDVFKFVMEMEKVTFPESIRVVAEKCGIAVPRERERTPEERRENQLRTLLVEMHAAAAAFFVQQLSGTPEGRAARAYLLDRGLDSQAVERFGIGFAPSGGDALLRTMKQKYPEKVLEASGLFSRDQEGRVYDRFRRRVMFPIANESGKIVAFGGRALGDDLPKYLNSPETPIYSKSNVLYHLDRAKDAIRREKRVILVEGYMDAIALALAGFTNVVASCGTSVSDAQVRLLRRFTKEVVVNMDPDSAGRIASERVLGPLAEEIDLGHVGRYGREGQSRNSRTALPMGTASFLTAEFGLHVLVLPMVDGKAVDPDAFIRSKGSEEYRKLLDEAPAYIEYLIQRAHQMDLSTPESKIQAINSILPHIQRIPDKFLRLEWTSRVAGQLRIEEPVLRESMRKAAAERRSEVKARPEFVGRAGKPAERRLVQMLMEAEEFRAQLAEAIRSEQLHLGLETERILAVLVEACESGARPDAATLAADLEDKDRRLLFEIAFEAGADPTREEAESCLAVLRRRKVEVELAGVQRQIETQNPAAGAGTELRRLLERKQELRRMLDAAVR